MKNIRKIRITGEDRTLKLAAPNLALLRSQTCGSGLSPRFPARRYFSLACLPTALIAVVLSGCSAGKPQLGTISVTNPTGTQGQLTSVVVNATANVSVTVGSDKPNLGVDWNLTCGGSPNSIETTNVCGTLNPVHVGSNINMLYTAPAYVPIGNTVTLTAHATTDPSVTSSVTITITPQPVTITWTSGNAPPPAMAVSGIQLLAASVSNDPNAAGVNWSVTCGSTDCGSFSQTLTASGGTTTAYTAPATVPAGGTVTVTATSVYDKTKSISATISINLIAVVVTASPTADPAGGPVALTATVSWDQTGGGVIWATPACGTADCGVISAAMCGAAGAAPTYVTTCTATYSAPPSIPAGSTTLPVTVTAVSSAAPASDPTRSGSAVITVGPPLPIKVSIAPAASSLQVNGSTTLTATAAYDYSNSGVNWQCSPGSCNPASSTSAPFTTVYTAPGTIPSPNPVTVTATSIAAPADDPTGSGTASITILPAIAVMLSPGNPTTITAGVAATFSATVTNDIASGGLTWTATCTVATNCGTFTSTGQSTSGNSVTYSVSFTAPNAAPWSANPLVTITATSVASETVPPVQSASASVNVTPVPYVSFVPFAPSSLPVSNPSSPVLTSLIAVAVNDASNAGVDWKVCSTPSTCGAFLIAPAVPATLSSAAVSATYASSIHAASGQVVNYLAPTSVPGGNTVTITAASTANPAISLAQAITVTSSLTGTALKGTVMAGNVPVSAASVQLYEAGNSGYGSAAFPIVISGQGSTVTTDQNGNFTVPAGYTCDSQNSLLYLVAQGGSAGSAGTNAQLGLMTALGPCSNLNSSVNIVVNEVTTVASVWALAPFTGTGYATIGSSSANYSTGLANAFATVNNLVDITTGHALLFTPAGGSYLPPGPAGTSRVMSGLVPQAKINTLADAIDTCAATAGGIPGDGSACDNFFYAANVDPVGGANPTKDNEPTSVLAAALEIARYPAKINIAATTSPTAQQPLYTLAACPQNASYVPPFTPNLIVACNDQSYEGPSDWTLSLSFTGGGLEGLRRAAPNSAAMAVDGSGNLWIANPNIASVSELSNLGVALSPYATGFRAGNGGGFTGGGLTSPTDIAIDPNGNAWVLNSGNSLTELDANGLPLTCGGASPSRYCGGSTLSSPFSGAGNANNTANGLAIDASGNVWVTEAGNGNAGDVAEYAGFNTSLLNGKTVLNGTPLSPAGSGFTTLTSPTDTQDTNPANPNGAIAIDGSGNVWLLDQGNYVAVGLNSQGSLQTNGIDHGYTQVDPNTGKLINPVLSSSTFGNTLVIDKSGNLFIPDNINGTNLYELYSSTSTACGLPNGQTCLGTGKTSVYGVQPSVAPVVAVDGAGNFWLWWSNQGSSTGPAALTEFTASGTPLNLSSVATYPSAYAGPVGYVNPYSANGAEVSPPYNVTTPQAISVDGSGNLWLLVNGSGIPTSLTEFVGVATPAVTPVSLGKPGKTP